MKPGTKLTGVWHCLERLARENNPRLVAIIEIKDARHLLETRAALTALVTTGISKGKIASAKRLLAKH
ncbi:hypothetical protein [Bradyrhizobium sp. 170]|uniref:hypothetical protein n=1 Tax=Bradyrhizobium sp. 170 TaxID=2782641 RepID=UPI001FFF3CA2|nr:hypothetical protein [Bradyrhizobium sp. 170]UPK03149.1 hypothetical protein IVB05_37335 [Bradyrhizobium sp. 170]